MARLDGVLWEYNLAKVVFVDVSDDYRFCQEPLPCEFYPVVSEAWLPVHRLTERLAGGVAEEALSGPEYLYDWHESVDPGDGEWYVGVVHRELVKPTAAYGPLFGAAFRGRL